MLFYWRADLAEGADNHSLVREMADLRIGEEEKEEGRRSRGSSEGKTTGRLKMPAPIERSILRQNVKFLHNRNQFSTEYFQFMRKLISCNAGK